MKRRYSAIFVINAEQRSRQICKHRIKGYRQMQRASLKVTEYAGTKDATVA